MANYVYSCWDNFEHIKSSCYFGYSTLRVIEVYTCKYYEQSFEGMKSGHLCINFSHHI